VGARRDAERSPTIAGHSKWAQIKRDKAKNDSARGASFTKVAREIIVASRLGGPDPAGNFRLRTAIDAAKAISMPADNIKRAIARGQGAGEEEHVEEIQYEGYGPGGVAIIVQAVTGNRNRTASDVRHYFSKYGGNMGETGCVGWMFQRRGVVRLAGDELNADDVLLAAADAGAEDVRDDGDGIEVLTAPDQLEAVHKALEAAGYQAANTTIALLPENTIEVDDPDVAKKLMKMLDAMENHDDVQDVYTNFDISDAVLATVGA
jgi:YebC/PmpR family DNA-binding regulatory protein